MFPTRSYRRVVVVARGVTFVTLAGAVLTAAVGLAGDPGDCLTSFIISNPPFTFES
jgi:hypothetical protein